MTYVAAEHDVKYVLQPLRLAVTGMQRVSAEISAFAAPKANNRAGPPAK